MNPDFSKISVSRVILWLVAITMVSFFLGFVMLALTGGFSHPDDLSRNLDNATSPKTTYDSLTPDGAESADIFIIMGAGDLTVSGGADKKNLVESAITTENPKDRPEITYRIDHSHGTLKITQNEHTGNVMFPGTLQNRWDIQLNDEIPLSLDVKTGAGNSKLNIGALNLTAVRVKMGAGDQVVDFTGSSRKGPDTEIICGVGDLTVRVPGDMNSRITVDNGVGDIEADGFVRADGIYRLRGYPDSPGAPTNIHVKQGVGTVTLEAV